MPGRILTLIAALLVVGAVAVALLGDDDGDETAARTLPTILQDDAELLHRSTEEVAATLDRLRELGVDWVRVTAGWSVIAPEPDSPRRPDFDATDPDAYPDGAWAALDRVVALARERGFEVNIDIAFWAPRWAVSRPSPEPDRQRWDVDPAAFADFAEAVARRYPDVTAFTIWNEPNFKVFLLPQWRREGRRWVPASPHLYREMLMAAVPRIRAHSDALVLIGALAAVGNYRPDAPDDGVPPLRFLRELACVDAELRPLDIPECAGFEPLPGDGFSHHPYSLGLPPWRPDPRPDNVRMGDLPRLVELLRRLHAAGRTERELPVYVTEYGYETNPPDPTQATTPDEQATFLPAADRVAWETDGVASFAQFLLRDLGERDGRTERERWGDYQSGLRLPDGRAKPAERAFAWSLAARAVEGGVSFWVHVRPARAPVRVRIARRDGERWVPVGDPFLTDAAGRAERVLDVSAGAAYRLEVGRRGRWLAAPPVAVQR